MTGGSGPSMWVKICGITNPEDAGEAIRAGADALGFNLWSKSKRFLPFEENADWIASLPDGVERVAVLVNAPLDEALKVAAHPAFHAVQFHGTESSAYMEEFAASGRPFIVARRLTEETALDSGLLISKRVLIDAAVPGEFGGTGVMLDLDLAGRFVQSSRERQVILAGGLTPENVQAAIEKVLPYGVDVASGVETIADPRRKSWEKVRRFVSAARNNAKLSDS
jgi:phosphoribosylanthranilate isomerase